MPAHCDSRAPPHCGAPLVLSPLALSCELRSEETVGALCGSRALAGSILYTVCCESSTGWIYSTLLLKGIEMDARPLGGRGVSRTRACRRDYAAVGGGVQSIPDLLASERCLASEGQGMTVYAAL